MRVAPVTVIQCIPTPGASVNDVWVGNMPLIQLTYGIDMPRPSIEQVAALGGQIQAAIDQAIANFELHWRSVSKGSVQ